VHDLAWRLKSEQDLQAIINWIGRDSPQRALSVAKELQSKALRLRENPLLYRSGRTPGTREMVLHPNYVLIDRITGDVIEILRIKHVKLKK
jgi:toxin ParE1/3/4